MHPGDGHNVHKARAPHAGIEGQILIEVRLLAQHQGFHENADPVRKKRLHPVGDPSAAGGGHGAQGYVPFSCLFQFAKRPGQVDVFGNVVVVFLPAAEIGPAKAGTYFQHVARTEFRKFTVIDIEHEVQFRRFRPLNQQAGIALKDLWSLQEAHGHALFRLVPVQGTADGRVPVQRIGCQAERATQKHKKCRMHTAVPCPFPSPEQDRTRRRTKARKRQDDVSRQKIKREKDGGSC